MTLVNQSGITLLEADITARLLYGQSLQDSLSRMDYEKGIDYTLSLSSGDGAGQVNNVWHDIQSIDGTGIINLSNLVQTIFGNDISLDVAGSGHDVKGIKLTNLSNSFLDISHDLDPSGTMTLFEQGSVILGTYTGYILPSGSLITIINQNAQSFDEGFDLLGFGGIGLCDIQTTVLGVGQQGLLRSGFSVGFSNIGFG